jgi:hypothetical protein
MRFALIAVDMLRLAWVPAFAGMTGVGVVPVTEIGVRVAPVKQGFGTVISFGSARVRA